MSPLIGTPGQEAITVLLISTYWQLCGGHNLISELLRGDWGGFFFVFRIV